MNLEERLQRYRHAKARFNRQSSLAILLLGVLGSLASGTSFVILMMSGHIALELLGFLGSSLALLVAGLAGLLQGANAVRAADEITSPW